MAKCEICGNNIEFGHSWEGIIEVMTLNHERCDMIA